jgi:flagellar brake protein
MKIELITPEDRGRYLVSHANEIERILREVMDNKTIVSLYGENATQFLRSTLVEVEPKQGFLLFEQGIDMAMNAALLGSKECTFTSTHEHVHIQFSSQQMMSDKHGQEAVFRVPMPVEILRMQRREYYRLETSVMNPVKCLINIPGGLLNTMVVDISICGVGVLAYPEEGVLKIGETFHGCRITLPGIGEFAIGLSVCTTFEIILKNGRRAHRVGCSFIDLPPSVETAIQRYIIQVDRERRARFG